MKGGILECGIHKAGSSCGIGVRKNAGTGLDRGKLEIHGGYGQPGNQNQRISSRKREMQIKFCYSFDINIKRLTFFASFNSWSSISQLKNFKARLCLTYIYQ